MQIFLIGKSKHTWENGVRPVLSIKFHGLSKRNRKLLRVIGLNDNNHVKISIPKY